MKIDITSDLHLDFIFNNNGEHNPKRFERKGQPLMHFGESDSDTLIIAGDIGHYNKQNSEFLCYLAEHHYKNVVTIHGNHDLYLVSRSQKSAYRGDSFKRLAEFAELCDKIDNVHYLDGDVVEIDGIKIAGSSLWYDFSYGLKRGMPMSELESYFERNSNDANLIMQPGVLIPHPYQHFTTSKTQIDNLVYAKEQKEKLLAVVKEHDPDVIVTHMPPDEEFAEQSGKAYGDPTFSCSTYCTDTSEFDPYIKGKTWIFGHLHDTFDVTKRGCRFVCNPFGYHRHEANNPFITIEVDVFNDIRIMKKYPELFSVPLKYGFECLSGWELILRELFAEMSKVVKEKNIGDFRVLQVKEKFGELRVYIRNHTKEIDEIIRRAVEKSSKTCDICGKPGELNVDDRAWFRTRCEEHKDDRYRKHWKKR